MNLHNTEAIYKEMISGLLVTLVVSIVSLIIGAGLSILLNRGLRVKSTFAKGCINVFMQIIKGIPFLIQLFIVYYLLPMMFPILTLNSITTAIIVLATNATVNITDNIDMYSGLLDNKLPKFRFMRIYLLFVLREFSETIKNSTLISMIGIAELYWATIKIEKESTYPYVFLITAIIYIIINLIIYFVCRWMKKKYFSPINNSV